MMPVPEGRFVKQYKAAFFTFLDQYADRINQWVAGKGVLGLVFHDHQVRMEPDREWGLSSLTVSLRTSFVRSISPDFDKFWNRYQEGLPNLQSV
jgi:hypothetical protein